MILEILYPELCNLYGDGGNVLVLSRSLPEAELVYTGVDDTPRFSDTDVDFLYLGSMTEASQALVLQKLLPYRDRLRTLMEQGKVFLLVGNAWELFNESITDENGQTMECLGLLPFNTQRYLPQRFNSLFLGSFDGQEIVGYTSRFSHTYGDNSGNYLFPVKEGLGINQMAKFEGVRVNNLFATYLLGPLLVSNPHFAEYLLGLLGSHEPMCFRDEALQAYEQKRLDIAAAFHTVF